jgi:hypothetical protein
MFVKARHLNSEVDYYVTTIKLLDGIFKTVVTKIVVQDISLDIVFFFQKVTWLRYGVSSNLTNRA